MVNNYQFEYKNRLYFFIVLNTLISLSIFARVYIFTNSSNIITISMIVMFWFLISFAFWVYFYQLSKSATFYQLNGGELIVNKRKYFLSEIEKVKRLNILGFKFGVFSIKGKYVVIDDVKSGNELVNCIMRNSNMRDN